MKVRAKLISGFALVALIAGMVGMIGVMNIRKIDSADTNLYEHMTVPIGQLGEIATLFHRTRVNLPDAILAETEQETKGHVDKVMEYMANMDKVAADFEKLILDKEMKQTYDEFCASREQFALVVDRVLALAIEGKDKEAVKAMDDGLATAMAEQAAIEKLTKMKLADAKETSDDNTRLANRSVSLMFTLICIAVALALGLGLFISKIIGSPMRELSETADRLALGDVDVHVEAHTKDEIGQLMRSMGEMVANIQANAQVADRIAAGDLNVEVKAASEKDMLGKSMIKVIDSLKALTTEAEKLSAAAVDGKLSTRGDTGKFQGGYREIVNGVNETLDAVLKPINEAAQVLQKLAGNDLTARVVGDYKGDHAKIKESLNNAMDAMESAVVRTADASTRVSASAQELAATAQDVGKASQSIAETINEVAAGSTEQSKTVVGATGSVEQLSQAIEEVARGAQSQAQTVEDTVSLVQQITQAIDSVARTAQSAAAASVQVAEVAKSGGDSVGKSVSGMARIKETTGNVAEAVSQLGENSKQIGAIVETIDDIAEQTNLLALNAAIEAARAGEHGKGFAVVADEVRKLAERSSMATKEIADLIGSIQQMTKHAVEAMQSGAAEVEVGTELANQAGEALGNILGAVNGIVQQIEDVSAATEQMSASSAEVAKAVESLSAVTGESTAATEEMAAASSEVTKSIEQIASISEENAASAEEVSAAAEEQNASVEEMSASAGEMARIAQELQEVVSQFKVSDTGLKVVAGNDSNRSAKAA
ncbi:MAG: methyl-accepting chemotaxis protein [Armatimonadota bacterium]